MTTAQLALQFINISVEASLHKVSVMLFTMCKEKNKVVFQNMEKWSTCKFDLYH